MGDGRHLQTDRDGEAVWRRDDLKRRVVIGAHKDPRHKVEGLEANPVQRVCLALAGCTWAPAGDDTLIDQGG